MNPLTDLAERALKTSRTLNTLSYAVPLTLLGIGAAGTAALNSSIPFAAGAITSGLAYPTLTAASEAFAEQAKELRLANTFLTKLLLPTGGLYAALSYLNPSDSKKQRLAEATALPILHLLLQNKAKLPLQYSLPTTAAAYVLYRKLLGKKEKK